MRALGVAMAFSCAVVMLPSLAYADRIGVHEGKEACALDADWSHEGRSTRLSVAAVNSEGHASAREQSPDIALWRGDDDAGGPLAVLGWEDVNLGQRGSLENSAHFANHGSAQFFSDDRTSFCDEIRFDGFGQDLNKHITIALRKQERKLEKELRKGGGALTPPSDGAPTPNPEPASMLLIGTGLAGLFRYRKQLFA